MAGKEIASGELITTVETLVRAVTGVGAHMPGDMLGTSEGGLTNRTLVVASHLFLDEDEEELCSYLTLHQTSLSHARNALDDDIGIH